MVHHRRRRRRHPAHGARQRAAAAGVRRTTAAIRRTDVGRPADAGDPAALCAVARAAVLEIDANQPVGRRADDAGVVSAAVSPPALHHDSRRHLRDAGAGRCRSSACMRWCRIRSPNGCTRWACAMRSARRRANLLRWCSTRACGSSPSGVVLGLAVAFVLARFLETQLFGVTAHDPGTFIGVGAPASGRRHCRLSRSRPAARRASIR